MDISTHEGDIPIPISTTYVLHDNNNNNNNHHHHPSSNGPPPPLPLPPLSIEIPYKKIGPSVKYRECLKNHAAAIGGNATDGCGEFMPSGEEGTLEALKCSACNCHRNFHRKETEGEGDYCFHLPNGRKLIGGAHHHKGVLIPRPTPHNMIMPLGAIQSSESDEMDGGVLRPSSIPMAKKRFRTKFSTEQKEKMMEFADRVGWRFQKQEESVIQHFCQEIGVKRRVLKVWMHNNKHHLAKKSAPTS